MYTFKVGITPFGIDRAKPDTEAIIENAKQRLEIFLGTLSLRAP